MKRLLLILSIVFSLSAKGQYTNLFNFSASTAGSNPQSTFVFDGTFLYGTTWQGGTNDKGTIFKILPDGTGYVKLMDFTGVTNGSNPFTLIYDGSVLYGTTQHGGANDFGTIFKINTNGTGYTKLLDFDYWVNGGYPSRTLILEGGILYGSTGQGGIHGQGTLFKIMTNGTGYVKLMEFSGTINGRNPVSLYSDGTFLFGLTFGGGTNDMGTIFKILPNGTGYVKLMDFSGISSGSYPYSSLISDGTFLYGMTHSGGTNNLGTIFKIMPNGTGYQKLMDFLGNANGSNPFGSLISDGTFLYGMTNGGGSNFSGTLFKIMPNGTGYVKLIDFEGIANGSNPVGSLISDGTFLYGMTSGGGSMSFGAIFKYQLSTLGFPENDTEASFTIFTNSNNGIVTIHSIDNKYEVVIVNMLGQTIHSSKITSYHTEIDLSYQDKGTYLVIIYDGKKNIGKKIQLQ